MVVAASAVAESDGGMDEVRELRKQLREVKRQLALGF